MGSGQNPITYVCWCKVKQHERPIGSGTAKKSCKQINKFQEQLSVSSESVAYICHHMPNHKMDALHGI